MPPRPKTKAIKARANATSAATRTTETEQRLAYAGEHAEGRPVNPLRQSFLGSRLRSRSCDRFVSGLAHGRRLPCLGATQGARRAGKTTSRNSGSVAKPARQEPGVLVSPSRSGPTGPMPWRGAVGFGQPHVESAERPQGWVAITTGGAARAPRSLWCRHTARPLGARAPG